MVTSSNRTPSPITSRSSPNLIRPSHTHQTQSTRRSLNGPSHLNTNNKFSFLTPANTPSEFGRRNFVGGEEKENEKEKEKGQFLKEKLRSPSKGAKSFMAPTFSAASKFTPSPRKKILVERNDPVRTSIALSDGKATFFSSLSSDFDRKLDFCTEEKNTEAVVVQQGKLVPEVPIVPKPLRKVTFKGEEIFNPHHLAESGVEKVAMDLGSEHNVTCFPHEPASKVLEDSPKVDVAEMTFEGSDSDGSKLKDSCMCELSDNLPFLEGLEQSETGGSRERLVDASSLEPLDTESLPLSTSIADEITHDSCVPKPKLKSRPRRSWKSVCLLLVFLGTLLLSVTNFPTMHSLVTEDFKFEFSQWSGVAEIAKVNFDDYIGKVRQWSANSISYMYNIVLPVLEVDKMGTLRFMNFEFSEWSVVSENAKVHFNYFTGKVKQWSADSILYLSKISLPVLEVDKMGTLRFMNFELFEWSVVAEIVKVHFHDFTGKVKQWSADSISYLSYLSKISLPVLEVDKMGPLQFANLTILENGCQINGFSYVNSKNKGFKEGTGLELEDVEEEEGEDDMEEANDQEMEEVEAIGKVEDARKEVEETYSSFDSTIHMVSAPEAPDTELKMDIFEDEYISDESDKSHEENVIGSSAASTKVENQDRFLDMVSNHESLEPNYLKQHASEIGYDDSAAETEILLEEKQPSTSIESKKMVTNSEIFLDEGSTNESGQSAEGPSLGDSRIQARTMIIGISLVSLGLGTVAVMIYLKQLSKKASICADSSPTFINKMTILQQEEPSTKDLIGKSCTSEMSYSECHSPSYQKKKNANRESLVYSSEYSFCSPSYGSFTTYETIPVKHGDGDEEIMTPVRRSSRIRKQVTSQ